MNKETRKNKKLYIALLICSIVAIIAIITTSLIIGLRVSPTEPVDNPSNIQTPDDATNPDNTEKPEESDDPNASDKPDTPDDPDEPSSSTVTYAMPIASYTEGQDFVVTDVVWSNTLHWYATHNGTDFVANAGTIVSSICDGTVQSVKYTTQDGYVITIAGTDGNTIYYKSLSSSTLVEEGATVSKGTQLGYVSDSMSSEQNEGAHLHLEIVNAHGEFVDPMSVLPITEK